MLSHRHPDTDDLPNIQPSSGESSGQLEVAILSALRLTAWRTCVSAVSQANSNAYYTV